MRRGEIIILWRPHCNDKRLFDVLANASIIVGKYPPITNRCARNPLPSPEPPRAEATLDITFETDALTTLVREFEQHGDAYRAHFSGARPRPLGAVASRPRAPCARRPSRQFHQGHRHRAGRHPARQRPHDQRGRHWRTQRKMVQPAFHRKVIATWMPHIHAATERLAAKMGSAPRAAAIRGQRDAGHERGHARRRPARAVRRRSRRAWLGRTAPIRSRSSPTTPRATSPLPTSSASWASSSWTTSRAAAATACGATTSCRC